MGAVIDAVANVLHGMHSTVSATFRTALENEGVMENAALVRDDYRPLSTLSILPGDRREMYDEMVRPLMASGSNLVNFASRAHVSRASVNQVRTAMQHLSAAGTSARRLRSAASDIVTATQQLRHELPTNLPVASNPSAAVARQQRKLLTRLDPTTMTDHELATLADATAPTPVVKVGGNNPPTGWLEKLDRALWPTDTRYIVLDYPPGTEPLAIHGDTESLHDRIDNYAVTRSIPLDANPAQGRMLASTLGDLRTHLAHYRKVGN